MTPRLIQKIQSQPLRMWFAVSLFFALTLVVYTMLDPDVWARRKQLEKTLQRTDADVKALSNQARELSDQINAVRNRRDVQERIIRDELGYIRDGEIILEFQK
jgi:cell division protein FtsB